MEENNENFGEKEPKTIEEKIAKGWNISVAKAKGIMFWHYLSAFVVSNAGYIFFMKLFYKGPAKGIQGMFLVIIATMILTISYMDHNAYNVKRLKMTYLISKIIGILFIVAIVGIILVYVIGILLMGWSFTHMKF